MFIYTHRFNAIAFGIGDIFFPWYWLNYVFGFCIVYGLSAYFCYKKKSLLPLKDLPLYGALCWTFLIIFARLGYALIYGTRLYIEEPKLIFHIWKGGMSFHGALVGCFLACLLVSYYKKQRVFFSTDLFCQFAPIALALGRLTNFINGELWGRPTSGGWGVIFPRDPAQVPRHPSQLYQALLEGFVLFIVLWTQRRRLQSPGKITSYFLIGYGVLRMIAEFYRMPDVQIGYLWSVFTMGHLLCFVMVILGLVLMFLDQKK